MIECVICSGDGRVMISNGLIPQVMRCPMCKGRGRYRKSVWRSIKLWIVRMGFYI